MAKCGFFGKCPHERDFVFEGLSARVADGVARLFSGWMKQAQLAAPETWHASYYNAPIWRFAIGPGQLGNESWIGLIMASADAVGRTFPLVVLISVEGALANSVFDPDIDRHFDELERDLLSFIDGQSHRKDVLAAVEQTAVACRGVFSRITSASNFENLPLDDNERAVCLAAYPEPGGRIDVLGAHVLTGRTESGLPGSRCYWWQEGSATRSAEICISRGFLDGPATASFFLGDWSRFGWEPAPIDKFTAAMRGG